MLDLCFYAVNYTLGLSHHEHLFFYLGVTEQFNYQTSSWRWHLYASVLSFLMPFYQR